MSFSREKLKIMIRKNAMLISRSIKFKVIDGLTGRSWRRTDLTAPGYHGAFSAASLPAEFRSRASTAAVEFALELAAGPAQPAPINKALVRSSGAAMKS